MNAIEASRYRRSRDGPLHELATRAIRYCHAIDERDWDAYRSVYTDDAIIDDIGAGPGNTVRQMVEFLQNALEKVVLIQHAISTSRVDIDGDTANAKIVCHCPVVLDRGDGQTEMYFQGLWYEDELVGNSRGLEDLKTGRPQLLSQHAARLPVVIVDRQAGHQL